MWILGAVLTTKEDSLLERLACGLFLILGIVQLLAVPMIFLYSSFSFLKMCVLLMVLVCMVLLGLKNFFNKAKSSIPRKKSLDSLKMASQKEKILLGILIVIIIGQLGFTLLFTHTDRDDAFYVVAAVDTIATDTMYQIDPHTGDQLRAFPMRYVLSPFPMVYALIGSYFDISPTIVAHVLLPILVIPLCYLVTYLLGMRMFGENREKAVFMTIIVAVLMMFQGATSYATGSFLLLRSWQGKSVLATIIIPYVIFLYLNDKDKEPRFWLKLLVVLIAGANVSSMGIMLTPIAVVVMGFITTAIERKWKPMIGSILCCIPSGIFALMYVIL